MITLAIETSQRLGEVAVRDHGGEIHVEPLATSQRHDDDLLPAIDRLFARLNLKPADLKPTDLKEGGAVAVSIGPGGFTGLRIAISTAKMFAETLGVKLIGVPSAVVAAEALSDQRSEIRGQKSEVGDQKSEESKPSLSRAWASGEVIVALASKNESAWCTRLRRDAHGAWMSVGESPPGLCEANTLDLNGIAMLFGDEHLPMTMRDRCAGAGVPIIAPRFSAAGCLRIGARMLERGETTDPLRLLPLYLRQPEAVTLWEARHPSK